MHLGENISYFRKRLRQKKKEVKTSLWPYQTKISLAKEWKEIKIKKQRKEEPQANIYHNLRGSKIIKVARKIESLGRRRPQQPIFELHKRTKLSKREEERSN